MNPLNRKMFRDPRAAKRATGILASSAPLMTAAQKAMAQNKPMRAQSGRSVNTQNRTLLEDLAALPSDVRAGIAQMMSGVSPQNRRAIQYPLEYFGMPVPDSAPGVPVGTVVSDLNRLLYGTDTSQSPVQSALRTADRAVTDALTATLKEPLPGVNQENIEAAARGIVGAFTPRPVAVSASPEEQQAMGEAEAARFAERQRIMELNDSAAAAPGAGTNAKPTPKTSTRQDPSYTPTGGASGDTGELSALDEALLSLRGTSSESPSSAAERMLRDRKNAQSGASNQTVPDAAPGAGEELAGRSSALTSVQEAIGEDAQTVIKPDTSAAPADAAADIADEKKNRSPGRGVTATQEQADANDDLLGIPKEDPDGKKLSRKERNQLRYEELVAMVGEDKAKDIRTDKSYNLMMLGLRIAAGQDPNALTNIARGAGQQLEEFGEVSGELSQKEAEQSRALKLQAVNEVGAEIAREEERKYTTSERLGAQSFQRAMQDTQIASQEAMKAVDLQWRAAEAALGRELTADIAKADRTLRLKLQEIQSLDREEDREAAYKRLMATHQFQADQAAEGRIFDLEKLVAAQDFAVKQGLNEQAFRLTLADFTASLPTGTQALYEKYLKPEQIAGVIMAGVTGNTAKAPSRAAFIADLQKNPDFMDQIRRDIATENNVDAKSVTSEQVLAGLNRMYDVIENYVAPKSN
jgi:hypothetical protein